MNFADANNSSFECLESIFFCLEPIAFRRSHYCPFAKIGLFGWPPIGFAVLWVAIRSIGVFIWDGAGFFVTGSAEISNCRNSLNMRHNDNTGAESNKYTCRASQITAIGWATLNNQSE